MIKSRFDQNVRVNEIANQKRMDMYVACAWDGSQSIILRNIIDRTKNERERKHRWKY